MTTDSVPRCPSEGVLLRRLLLFLFVLFVAGETLVVGYDYRTDWYHPDRYWFLDAAIELVDSGVPRLPSLPNSAYGMDRVAWTHHFPPYLYAAGVRLFDLRLWHLVLIRGVELALVVCAVVVLFRCFMSIPWSIAFAALVFLEPVFHLYFVGWKFSRWALIFGLLSLVCVIHSARVRSPWRSICLQYFGGFGAAMAPISFVSIGIPILTALTGVILLEAWNARRRAPGALVRVAAFGLGVATPPVVFGVHLLHRMGIDQIEDVVITMTRYGTQVASDPQSLRSLLEIARFYSTLLVPYKGLSLLPVGIAATLLNLSLYREMEETERFQVRSTVICTGVSLAFAAIVPRHFDPGRMTWILPFFLLQIAVALRHGPAHAIRFGVFVCFGGAVLAVQAVNALLGFRLPAASFALLPSAALLLASVGTIMVWRSEAFRHRLNRHLRIHGELFLVLAVVLVSSQPLARYAGHWMHHLPLAFGRQAEEPIAKRLIPEVRRIAHRLLRPGDWVLTNAPIREFFPDGVRRQEFFFAGKTIGDPGLGGARKEPATRVFLVLTEGSVPDSNQLRGYGELSLGQTIYYRGHFYWLNEQQALIPGFRLLIGDPVTVEDPEGAVYHDRFVSRARVDAYLEWRERNGVPVD